jgi:peptidyl-prolyl cis-trans isomerase D
LSGVLVNPKVIEAVFAEESVSKRRNTAAIEVGNNTLVSVRIVNHRPAALRPFAEVKDLVRAQYVREQSLVLAKAAGQKQLTEWQAQTDKAQLGPALVVSRDQAQTLAPALLDAALRADPAKLPVLVGVDLGTQGYAVVRVNKLVARDEPNAQQQQQSRQQFARLLGNAEAAAYLAHLRAQFKVEILVPKPQPSMAS